MMTRLHHWFLKWPLRKKMVACSMLVVLSTILPMIGLVSAYEYQSLKQAEEEDAHVHAAIIADAAAASMAFLDAKAANEAIASIKASDEIAAVALLLPDNTPLASWAKSGESMTKQELAHTGTVFYDHYLILKKPVLLNGNVVGMLVLKNSLEGFYQRISMYFIVILLSGLIAVLLSFWLANYLSDLIAAPINALIAATQSVENGEELTQKYVAVHSHDEFGELFRSFKNMMSKLHLRDVSMQKLAYYDAVTQLPNRHFFEQRIEQSIADARANKRKIGLLFIDLDDFKLVNDAYGHDTGDLVLRELSKRLQSAVRHGEQVCRVGGDEFTVIIQDVREARITDDLAARIVELVAKPFIYADLHITIGASIGISLFPDIASDKDSLIATADKAMYAAKALGKNRYQRYQAA